MAVRFTLNGRDVAFDGDASMPLLWYLRDYAGLAGTRFGCGVGACGACTVHIDERATRSCSRAMSTLDGREVRTIEGLAQGETLHPVQQAWLDEDVPQCGYCQAGQIMAAAALLSRTPSPSDEEINGLTNLCRCGTYPKIRKALHRAAALLREEKAP